MGKLLELFAGGKITDALCVDFVLRKLEGRKGGPGSGNFGHVGRPGEVGGSGEGSGTGTVNPKVETWARAKFGSEEKVVALPPKPFAPSHARKQWMRQATIDLWLKAERHAEADIEDVVLTFLQSQRADVTHELRRLAEEKPAIALGKDAAERIIEEAFKPREWDEELVKAIAPAIARTIARGYLSSKAVQAGRRRRFSPVWRKGGAGSGNFGHAGRPGEVGGSSGEGGVGAERENSTSGTKERIANGDFSHGVSSGVEFLHGSRHADKIIQNGFDMSAAGLYSGSGEISGINLTLNESVARRFAGSSGSTLSIKLTRDISPEEILDAKTKVGQQVLESIPGGEKGRQALIARGIVAVADYNAGGALGGEGEFKVLDPQLILVSPRKGNMDATRKQDSRSGHRRSDGLSNQSSISGSATPHDGRQSGIRPGSMVNGRGKNVEECCTSDRRGLFNSRLTKQGWADMPLTEDEIQEVVDFELPPSVTRAVFKHTKTIMEKPYWKDVNDTEKQRMQWSIQEGIEEGKTLKQIAKDIQEDIGSDEVRARRIATTELTGSLNAGHVVQGEEAEEAGVKIAKVWVTIGDDKVRPEHEEMDGVVVEGTDGLFNVNGYEVPYPGHADLPAELRVNCRCLAQIEPILAADEEPEKSYIQVHGRTVDVEWREMAEPKAEKGGPGSGNYGHAGRPGEVGGSAGEWTSGGGETLHSATRDKDGIWKTDNGEAAPKHVQQLGIPPAWKNVYVNADPKGDMMARGNDAKGRLQVRYSDNHNMRAAADKFGRVAELRTHRVEVLKEVDKDAKSGDTATRENAECLRLVMTTGIRPGSDRDTKAEKQAYGATTLEGRHVVVKGEEVRLKFTGKKGVDLDLPVTDPKTATILMDRAKSVGKNGRLFDTDANSLRDYSKERDGGGFKTKDHRTALGTETAISVMRGIKSPATLKEYKSAVKTVASRVSSVLGNTPAIAMKAYIDPNVFSSWRNKAGV